MTDTVSKATRSQMMSRVKNRDTYCEVALRQAMWSRGMRGWRTHGRHLPGRPDIYFPRWRVAIFVDGAFWHGHPSRYRPGRSGIWWDQKIEQNVARDAKADSQLRDLNWTVVRIWDFEVISDPVAAVEAVVGALQARGHNALRPHLKRSVKEIESP